MIQEHSKHNGKVITTASKFQRVFFSVHLVMTVTYPYKERKGRSSKSECYMCLRCILTLTQQLSHLVAKFGKEIVEYIWKEQNLFSSKRKWKVLFYFSFFSSLIGLCIQIFLYCHLNWIDRDNLLFFHGWKK